MMGEAKRRKQKLKAEYGKPLGLSNEARRDLIKNNLEPLLRSHYQETGYTDWLDRPCSTKFRLPPESSSNEPNFDLNV